MIDSATFRYLSGEDLKLLNGIAENIDTIHSFPTAAFRVIVKNRHFQLFVPSVLGGLGLDLPHAVQIIEEYSYIDGNMGWIVQIGAGGGMFSSYLPENTARHFFSSPQDVIAGSDFVGGEAIRAEGGYRVTGRWNYASGSQHATAFTGNVRIIGGTHSGEIRAFITPSVNAKVEMTWNAMGMRATDSHAFRVEDVFIPSDQFFSLDEDSLKIRDYVLNRIPFLVFARAVFVPVLIGSAVKYSFLFRDMLERKKVASNHPAWSVHLHLSDFLDQWKDDFYKKTRRIWTKAVAEDLDEEITKDYVRFCIEFTTAMVAEVSACHRFTGMEGIRLDSRINAVFRNIITASAHYLLSAESA